VRVKLLRDAKLKKQRQLATLFVTLSLFPGALNARQTPMLRMEKMFADAKAAKPTELTGSWVLVKQVFTQEYVNGENGPDHVVANSHGIRHRDVAAQVGKPADIDAQSLNGSSCFAELTSEFRPLRTQSGRLGARHMMCSLRLTATLCLTSITAQRATSGIAAGWLIPATLCACFTAAVRVWNFGNLAVESHQHCVLTTMRLLPVESFRIF
jgi:hypothetical protein